MIRRRDSAPRAQPGADALPRARPGAVLRRFEDRGSEEEPEFASPPRKSPLEALEAKNRSGTYDYFGSISGLFAKTDSRAKLRFEDFFKSPSATPMKDKQISSFTKGGLLSHSSDKKKSSEKKIVLQLDAVRLELDFPVPTRIGLAAANKPQAADRPDSDAREGAPGPAGPARSCAVCRGSAPAEAWRAGCCGAAVCARCQRRFYSPATAERSGRCAFCESGAARLREPGAEEDSWRSL